MFETLVVTQKERTPLRRWFTLPLAATLHLAVGGAYLAAGLYSPQEVLPPSPKNLFAPPPIPVVFVHRAELETRNQRPTTKSTTNPLVPTHDNLPSEVLPAPPKTEQDQSLQFPPDLLVLPSDGPPDGLSPINGPVALIRVENLLTPPRLLDMVKPEYPPALRAMRLTGKVVFELVVDEAGAVAEVKLIQSSNPVFTEAAERAVRQWRYSRPLAPGGGQCRVSMVVTLRFTTG